MPIQTPTKGQFMPRNSRSPEIATRTLERLAEAAKLQYSNAIYVNGVDSLIYPRLEHGRQCSCRSIQLTSRLDESGNLSQDDINTLLSGEDIAIRMPGEKNPTQRRQGAERIRLDDLEIFALPTEPKNSTPDRDQTTPFIIDDIDLLGAPTTEETQMDTAFGITPAGRSVCAVCFGTGHVGGYSLFGGFRLTLDSTYPLMDMHHGYLDNNMSPQAFVSADRGASFTFTALLPRGVNIIHSLRVFDNMATVDYRNYLLQIKNSSGDWDLLTQPRLHSYCDGYEHEIRVTADKSNDFRFTHIEIQGSMFADMLRIDFPKLDKNPYLAVFDGLTGSQLVIPPTVGELPYLSAISDSLYGKTWLLTNVTEFNDHRGHVHGWESLGRIVQPYEVHHLLVRPGKAWTQPMVQHSTRHNQSQNRKKFL